MAHSRTSSSDNDEFPETPLLNKYQNKPWPFQQRSPTTASGSGSKGRPQPLHAEASSNNNTSTSPYPRTLSSSSANSFKMSQNPYNPKTSQPSRLPNDLQNRLYESARKRGERRRRLALLWSYLPDWLLAIGLSGCFYLLDYINGYWREFSLTDTSIQHSFTEHERVPNSMLIALAGGAPLVLLPIINLLTIRSYWDLHNSWLGLLLSLSLTGVVSQAVKVTVGRPRPDLIARCIPREGSANHPVFGLVTAEICTQTDILILKDGFRSFPSAHSSLSFAGLGFLALYLSGKLHLFDERGHSTKAWLGLTPLVGAALIAISRTMDYRHHWQDVLTGSILGFGLAYFSYRQYYPPLEHVLSHRPYSPRIPADRYRAYRDEEEAVVHSDTDSVNGAPVTFPPATTTSNKPLLLAQSNGAQLQADYDRQPTQPAHSRYGSHRSNRTRNDGDNDTIAEAMELDVAGRQKTIVRPHRDLDDVWREGEDNEGVPRRDAVVG